MKKKSFSRSPVCMVCSALGTALLIILILMCIPFTLPRVLGYQAYTVVSGSMEPAISVGSLVYVKEMEPEDVLEGDIIAYYGNRSRNTVVTHRVAENDTAMGKFITKGDANRTGDMNPVEYNYFIGKVEMIIPKLGIAAQFMTGREGKIAAGCMIGLAVVLHLLAVVLGRERA